MNLPGYEQLRASLNSQFIISNDHGQRQVCELIAVSERIVHNDFESFSASFKAVDFNALNQGIYNFAHEQIGTCQMFVSPYELAPDRRPLFEAVFNRQISPA